MRSFRVFKAAVVSVAVGSALMLSGCAGGGNNDKIGVPPLPPEGKVIAADAHKLTKTPGSTGVVFTEFTDFQCPACASVHKAVDGIAETYEGKIDLAVRNYPLKQHQNAEIAAYAVEAAVLQSPDNLQKFSDELFETQQKWGTLGKDEAKTYFVSVAEKLGLDKDKFSADYDSDKVKDRVAADVADGNALNLMGTPSMFIGNKPVDLSQVHSDADIYKMIDDAIDESKSSASPASSASPSPSN